MQTCKSDIAMLDQAYAKKLVHTVMQDKIKQTNKKKQQEKPKNNAPPN